jgi:hypothetical protein
VFERPVKPCWAFSPIAVLAFVERNYIFKFQTINIMNLSLVSFLEKNPELLKADDWNNLEEQLKDAIFCKNIDGYLREWLKANAQTLIREFHKSKSDVNPMEDETEEMYISDFESFISSL